MAIKLEIGSGEYPRDFEHKINSINKEQYIHLDIRHGLPHQEIQGDIFHLPFSDNSIEEILTTQTLEHLNWQFVHEAIWECYRVLKIGGVFKAYTPDIFDIIDRMKRKEITFIVGINWIYGGRNYEENWHKGGFCEEYMREILENARFKILKIAGGNGLWVEAQK